jgi:ATPase subunit of ABC transporter with duplicated ATPase domains
MARVEQHLPDAIFPLTMLDAVLAQLPLAERDSLRWKAETLLAGMGFTPQDMTLRSATLSGGQHPAAAGAGVDSRAGSAPAG